MPALLKQFIQTFQKAIQAEMTAMRQQMGPFEIPLSEGQTHERTTDEPERHYRFKVLQNNDKLVIGAECTLVYDGGQTLITITGLAEKTINFQSSRKIPLNAAPYTLVVYPWFLYERLIAALEGLSQDPTAQLESAYRLFGKVAPQRTAVAFVEKHRDLNVSQQRAVHLCLESNLAFVWGPPGTGKTTTLAHIVYALLRQGKRVLLTSTTHAAVDQALAKLADLAEVAPYFARGQILRVGQTQAKTYGAALDEVVDRLNSAQLAALRGLVQRLEAVNRQHEQSQHLLGKLGQAEQPVQLGFFQATAKQLLTPHDLADLFSPKRIPDILNQTPADQQQIIARRGERLSCLREFLQTKIKQLRQGLTAQELAVIQGGQVILATMANLTISQLLSKERYDVVIVEEAGMAILANLFYCATLAKEKLIMVGDPQQLPPIVQARDTFVHQAIGRNIFAVTAPDPYHCEWVVMLETQYRMHPVIGDLVSHLYYAGNLRHAQITQTRQAIAAHNPYPEAPLVIVDTQGQTRCATGNGSFSRFNEQSGQICLELAVEAIQSGIESVAIITPYVAQARFIRQALARSGAEKEQIVCHTVHRFQGNERDVVIFDPVDTAPFTPGILLSGLGPTSQANNLINVSLSRAKGKLILVADLAYYQQRAAQGALNQVLRHAQQAGLTVSRPSNQTRLP